MTINQEKSNPLSKKKAVLGSLASLFFLVFSQGIASLWHLIPLPFGLSYLLFTLTYVGLTYLGLKLMSRKLLGKQLADMGIGVCHLKSSWMVMGLALPICVTLAFIIFLPGKWLITSGSYSEIISQVIAAIFATSIGASVVEEMVFRGVIMTLLKEAWAPWVAILVPSLLFGLLHLLNGHVSLVSGLLLVSAGTAVGVMFSLQAETSGSIWASAISHCLWNILMIGNILSISSLPESQGMFHYQLTANSVILTGGEFGVESSLFALIGYISVSLLVLCLAKKELGGFKLKSRS